MDLASDLTRAQRQVEGLSAMLQFTADARTAEDLRSFGFVAVNDIMKVLPVRTALLWRRTTRWDVRVLALSGLASLERDAPFTRWSARVVKAIWSKPGMNEVRVFGAADVSKGLARDWESWMAPHGLWMPLAPPRGGMVLGGLWLSRTAPFTDRDVALAKHLAQALGETMAAHVPQRPSLGLGRWLGRLGGLALVSAAVAALLLVKVPQSVLAPTEVVAEAPHVVASPMDAVVESVAVDPGATVRTGDLLFVLDGESLRNRYDVARKAIEVAEAAYRRAAQEAFRDADSRARMAMLKADMEQEVAKANALLPLLDRLEVRSPADGIVLFSDPNDWRGRPVQTGERVMLVANPDNVSLSVAMPAEDAILMSPGAPVRFFRNAAPDAALNATITRTAFAASPSDGGGMAYTLKAKLDPNVPKPRIGTRGTARIYGSETTLGYLLFRKPLAWLRRHVGL